MNPQRKFLLLFACTLAYAVLRYHVLGGVPWSSLPLYVSNKAISWTGLVLFGMSLLARETELRRYYGIRAAAAIALHTVLSLMVLNPVYFPKFYGGSGRMTAAVEISMLAGAAGLLILAGLFYLNSREGRPAGASLRAGWGRAVLWCAALHVAAMGYAGWLAPWTWHGYLPPITLLSFVLALGFLFARGRAAR